MQREQQATVPEAVASIYECLVEERNELLELIRQPDIYPYRNVRSRFVGNTPLGELDEGELLDAEGYRFYDVSTRDEGTFAALRQLDLELDLLSARYALQTRGRLPEGLCAIKSKAEDLVVGCVASGMSRAATGRVFGVSRKTVSRILERAGGS